MAFTYGVHLRSTFFRCLNLTFSYRQMKVTELGKGSSKGISGILTEEAVRDSGGVLAVVDVECYHRFNWTKLTRSPEYESLCIMHIEKHVASRSSCSTRVISFIGYVSTIGILECVQAPHDPENPDEDAYGDYEPYVCLHERECGAESEFLPETMRILLMTRQLEHRTPTLQGRGTLIPVVGPPTQRTAFKPKATVHPIKTTDCTLRSDLG